jgi:hypothetical protein
VAASTSNPVTPPRSDPRRSFDRSLLPGAGSNASPVRAAPVDAAVLERIRSEFREMPGLSPTLAQASRLFALPAPECAAVLDALQSRGILRLGRDGQYRVV